MTDTDLTRAEVVRYLNARVPTIRPGNKAEGRAPCPIHAGTRDSFAISIDTGRWICHSCDRRGDLFALEMALSGTDFKTAKIAVFDLIGRVDDWTPAPSATRGKRRLGPVVAEYIYRDEGGAVLFRVTRHDPKDFRQWRPDGRGGWLPGLGNTRRVLYHLPEILEAPIVFIVEGEKDVEALRSMGFVATCNPMGAGKWRGEYNEFFRGRTAILIPDQDEPGRAHARDIIQGIRPVAANVFVVTLDDAKDIAEWFEKGHSEVELVELLEGAWEQVTHG